MKHALQSASYRVTD